MTTAIITPDLVQPIQPIPTWFDGILFRSRTEARWAVFFTSLELAYQYEAEGYDIDGTWYLPDFYIPEWCYFIEIKPYGKPDDRALELVAGLQRLTKKRAIIFAGNPGWRKYQVWLNSPEPPDISPVLLGSCRRCEKGVWYFGDEGYGHLARCEVGCSSEKNPGGDNWGRIGKAHLEAGAYRFPRGEEMLNGG